MRALDILRAVDVVFAEDTRVTRKLFSAYTIHTPLQSYHEHSAETARDHILALLAEGRRVALVSDAGTPLISDPGYKLVRAAIEAGAPVTPAPGASAALAALCAAGLPTDRFFFAGFTPAKSAARRALFEELAPLRATLVFYETGPRLAASLADMADMFPARAGVIARELTKMFEEFRRAPLAELATHYAEVGAPKGEIVVLVSPPEDAEIDDAALDAFLSDALAQLSVKQAAAAAAEQLGVSKRIAYARALALKDGAA